MKILGLSALYHDSAAALVIDVAHRRRRTGRALHPQEARHRLSPRMPPNTALSQPTASRWTTRLHCLLRKAVPQVRTAARNLSGLRPARTALVPDGHPSLDSRKALSKESAVKELKRISPSRPRPKALLFTEHHHEPCGQRLFPSPFEEAADSDHGWRRRMGHHFGRHRTRNQARNDPRRSISPTRSACSIPPFTYYTGFKVNSGEYKLMGLAPYGEPVYTGTHLRQSHRPEARRIFPPDMDYFDYCTGLTMTNARFDELFGGPRARAGGTVDPAAHGSGGFHSNGSGRGGSAYTRSPGGGNRHAEPLPGWRRGLELRLQRQDYCATANSTRSGFSRQPGTPAAPWARHWPLSPLKNQPRTINPAGIP